MITRRQEIIARLTRIEMDMLAARKEQKDIALLLRHIRVKEGITLEVMSERTGLKSDHIGEVERGVRPLGIAFADDYLKALKFP